MNPVLALTLASCTMQPPAHNPYKWTPHQTCLAAAIVRAAELNNIDPLHMLAIAWAESNLRPHAINNASYDYGMMQINYTAWHEAMDYDTRVEFAAGMRDPARNISAAIHVVNHYRTNHKHCRGVGKFRCYNGGAWWWRQRTTETDEEFEERKQRVTNYHRRLLNVTWRLNKYYGTWIAAQRDQVELQCQNEQLASHPIDNPRILSGQ